MRGKNEEKTNKQTNKQKQNNNNNNKNERKIWRGKKETKKPSILPSLGERSETPGGALNRCVHWESQETPIAQSHLSASLHIAGNQRSGCRRGHRESILYVGAEPTTRLLGRQTFRS